jgi:phenylalanyl-tRNA synthetase beta chain
MKVSLNTVKQYTKVDLPVDELVHKLNQQLGGVEQVTDLGAKYKDAVIVQVVSAIKHDNADKLSVCMVDDRGVVPDVARNADGLVRVVCGAPNVHAGMLAVWLPPKSTVPSSFNDAEPFVLDVRDIRGITSNGMLAAADELAIGTDHEGIIEIDPSEWRPYETELEPGASFAESYGLNDRIIDIENKMFTHRPDCFGQLGVAREIAGIQHHKFASPDWYWKLPVFKKSDGLEITVTNDAAEQVPRFMAVAVKDVEVKPSPLWLQCALIALGSKPINNVVDVTNYVMLVTGQPLHAYDYDKLRGHALGVRLAHEGEKLPLLNGKTYACDPSDIVIVDGEGPVGMGGVMGGGNSEVSADTKNIVLEAATFDMYTIRKTSMRHGLFTDAVTRFNKGQSPLQNDRALNLALVSIFDTAGGTQASNVYDTSHFEPAVSDSQSLSGTMTVQLQFINDRLGLSLDAEAVATLLRNVEFACIVSDDALDITAPFWRTDIELAEDIVEEIGRLYGFDKLPRELPARSIKPVAKNPSIELKQAIRRVLSRSGANEVLTYSFVHENVLKHAGQDHTQAYKLGNALSPDLQYYRLTLIPSLLTHVHPNIKAGHDSFALFEIGKGHTKDQLGEDNLPKEFECVASVVADKKKSGAAYFQAKRLLEELLSDFGLQDQVEYVPFEVNDTTRKAAYFAPGRAAVVKINGEPIGRVGEFTASVRKNFKLPGYSAGFELGLAQLLALQTSAIYTPLSRFPYVTQDISLVIPRATTFAEVYKLAQQKLTAATQSNTAVHTSLVDIYQPEDGDTKTITLRIRVTNHERTLTEAEVTSYLDSINTAVADTYHA